MNIKDRPQYTKGPLTREDQLRLRNAIEGLEQDPQAYDFLEPVDYVGKNKL